MNIILIYKHTIYGDNMYYLNTFLIYSFIGFIIESVLGVIKGKKIGSGILYGPWTPIYGFGCVLILLISNFIFKIFNLNNVLELIISTILITIILTTLELIAGILIEKIFHVVFWDYTKLKFNFGKYISLETSLCWMIGSILVIYVLQPLIDKFIFYIPNYISFILIFLMIIDFIIIFVKKKPHK